jgi:hypothetical protein
MLANGLASAALVISLITFVLSYRAATATERRSRLPVLVFVYDGNRWLLRNVGNGPALGILVAQKHMKGSQAGNWYNPVRVPPSHATRSSPSPGWTPPRTTASVPSIGTSCAPTWGNTAAHSPSPVNATSTWSRPVACSLNGTKVTSGPTGSYPPRTTKETRPALDHPKALASLLPVGLKDKVGPYDDVFRAAFNAIVVQRQPIRAALDAKAGELQAILNSVKARCWRPDPPSRGSCKVGG